VQVFPGVELVLRELAFSRDKTKVLRHCHRWPESSAPANGTVAAK
jgi:hypothetical protein